MECSSFEFAVLFMPWMPMPRCTATGSTSFSNDKYPGSAGFSGIRIVSYLVVPLQHFQVDLRITMTGESDEPALALLLRLLERFDGSAGSEDLLHFLHLADLVNLPEVE